MSLWYSNDGEWIEADSIPPEVRQGRPAIRFPIVLPDGSIGAVHVDCDLETVKRWDRGDEAARQLIRDQLLGIDA